MEGVMPLCIPYSEELRLQKLRARRKVLWKRFEDNPNEIHLAAKLKIIDDQIAERYEQICKNDNKVDGSEVTVVPDVGGLFLLLSLTHSTGSQTDQAQSALRDSTSEIAGQRISAATRRSTTKSTARAGRLPSRLEKIESFGKVKMQGTFHQ
jgi:hypothetical protein